MLHALSAKSQAVHLWWSHPLSDTWVDEYQQLCCELIYGAYDW